MSERNCLIHMEDKFIENLNYRDFSFPIYQSDHGYYTILSGKEIHVSDQKYEIAIKRLIDRHLDAIAHVDTDAWLEWFDNGSARDIRLISNDRIIHVFLVSDPAKIDVDSLLNHSRFLVNKYRNSLIK